MKLNSDFYHYLPVDDAAMEWGIYVTGAGCARLPASTPYPPRGHPGLYDFRWSEGRTLPEFACLMVTDGGGEFESESTGVLPVEAGTLFFLFPGIWHRYRPGRESGWRELWITFNGELAQRLMSQRLIAPALPLSRCRDRPGVQGAFEKLLRDIDRHPTRNSILLSMRLMGFLADAIERSGLYPGITCDAGSVPATREIDDAVVRAAVETIWTHSHRSLSVARLAGGLDVNRRTLERRFRDVRGHSILEEILQCRLSRARRLLKETRLPVKAIAYLAGFPTPERMRVAFTSRYGVSPGACRR